MTVTLQQLEQSAAMWRTMLEQKGYHDIHTMFRCEPVNDEFRVELYFYNSEWSSTYLPGDMQKTSIGNVADRLDDITRWIRKQKGEHEAREEQLLKDFAAIKERIAASNLSDLIKTEAEALLKKMTTNILTYEPDEVHSVGGTDTDKEEYLF